MNFNRPPSYERRGPPVSYRPSYLRRNETPWWRSRPAMVGYLAGIVLAAVGAGVAVKGALAYNDLHGEQAVNREIINDPQIIPRDELARDYNVHIYDNDRIRVDLRQVIKDDSFMKRLKASKESGTQSEMYIVIVDDSKISVGSLTDEQKQIPGLVDYLSSPEFTAKAEKLTGNWARRTVDGVTREYITIASREDRRFKYQEPDQGQNLPGGQSFEWRTDKEDYDTYPIVGGTLAIVLDHEIGHANELGHPGADLLGVVQRIQDARDYYDSTGSDAMYPFHIRTTDGVDIITQVGGGDKIGM